MLATAHGPRQITFYIPEPDAAGGFLTFRDYRLDGTPTGLRGCDFTQLVDQMYEALSWPQKPAAPPTITSVQPDTRIHVKHGTNWAGHKQAHAEQRLAEERK